MKKIDLLRGCSLFVDKEGFGPIGIFSNVKHYAVKESKDCYSIREEDSDYLLDIIKVTNGVVRFTNCNIINYLHTFGKYAYWPAYGQRWLLGDSPSVLLSYAVKRQPGEYISTIDKLVGASRGGVKETTRLAHTHTKPVKGGCAAARYLSGIISSCPTAKVEWEALPSIKSLRELTRVPVGSVEYAKFIRLVSNLRRLSGRVVKTGEWHYTTTQEEFNALVLMQGYTPDIDSCQYFPVHKISSETARLMVTDTSKFCSAGGALTEDKTYIDDQWKGFTQGVRYFFQLNEEGLVSKRFYVWEKDDALVGNNYYNVIARPCTITYKEGEVVNASPVRRSWGIRLNVYINKVTPEALLPSRFTEESLVEYLEEELT